MEENQTMIEIRIHGRGGQGAVTSAELVAIAAIDDGKYAQAFPSFGPERRGAPVAAFIRVSDKPIRTREKVYVPNVVMVLDPSILKIVNVAAGLKEGGTVIINTSKTPEEMARLLNVKAKIATVDATKIAMESMGVPITNTSMLGALVKATGIVSNDALGKAIDKRFGRIAEKNKTAFNRAMTETIIRES